MATNTRRRIVDTTGGLSEHRDAFTIGVGGIAAVLAGFVAIAMNLVLMAGEIPAPDASVNEILAYVEHQADQLMTAGTARYGMFLLLVIFGAGLHRLLRGSSDGHHRAWAVLGLTGIAWLVSVGLVANSIELAGVWQAESMTSRPEMLMTFWSIGSVLFVAATISWGIVVLGFTVAGLLDRSLPRWLIGFGILTSSMCIVGGLGVGSVVNQGWAQYPWFLSEILFLVWLLLMGTLMMRRSLASSRLAQAD